MMQYQKDEKLLNLLKGKRVAIVGPSPHLIGTGAGKEIDSYDLVCRVNEVHPTGYEEDYGNKTDIVFHNCGTRFIDVFAQRLLEKSIISKYLKYVICPCVKATGPDNWQGWPAHIVSPVVANFNKINIFNIPFHWIGLHNYREIFGQVGTEPNAGQTAITMLLKHDVEELLVTGFSFYAQGNHSSTSHRPGHTNKGLENEDIGEPGHKQAPQKIYFKDYILKNHGHQLRLDSYISELLGCEHRNTLEL